MKLKCVRSDNHRDRSFTVGKIYEATLDDCGKRYSVRGDDLLNWAVDKEKLEFAGDPDYGVFEIVQESPVQESPLQEPTVSLEQIAQWCKQLNVDINITSDGTYNVFNGDTDQQCEVGNTEHLMHLLQIMVSHKETMGEYEWM